MLRRGLLLRGWSLLSEPLSLHAGFVSTHPVGPRHGFRTVSRAGKRVGARGYKRAPFEAFFELHSWKRHTITCPRIASKQPLSTCIAKDAFLVPGL
jgi:hypothetical protein